MDDYGDRSPYGAGREGLLAGPAMQHSDAMVQGRRRVREIEVEQALLGAIPSNKHVLPSASWMISDRRLRDPIQLLPGIHRNHRLPCLCKRRNLIADVAELRILGTYPAADVP